MQHDFVGSTWPSQTAEALLLRLTYLLRAEPERLAKKRGLNRSKRPLNDPPLPARHTKAAPVEVNPSCLSWTSGRVFCLFSPHTQTHLSSVCVSLWVESRARCRLSNIDVISPPRPPSPCRLMRLIKICFHLHADTETRVRDL